MSSDPYSYNYQIYSQPITQQTNYEDFKTQKYQFEQINTSFPNTFQTNSVTYNQVNGINSYYQTNDYAFDSYKQNNEIDLSVPIDGMNSFNQPNIINENTLSKEIPNFSLNQVEINKGNEQSIVDSINLYSLNVKDNPINQDNLYNFEHQGNEIYSNNQINYDIKNDLVNQYSFENSNDNYYQNNLVNQVTSLNQENLINPINPFVQDNLLNNITSVSQNTISTSFGLNC